MFEPSPVLLPQRTGPAATGAGTPGRRPGLGTPVQGTRAPSLLAPARGERPARWRSTCAASCVGGGARRVRRGLPTDWYDAPVRPEVRALMTLEPGPVLVAAVHAVATGSCPAPHAGEALPGAPAPGAGGRIAVCLPTGGGGRMGGLRVLGRRPRGSLHCGCGRPGPRRAPDSDRPDRRGSGSRGARPGPEHLADLSAQPDHGGPGTPVPTRALVALVESGACSPWAARVIVLEVASLPVGDAREVVADVVDRIRHRHLSGRRRWAPAELRRATRSARLRAHPDSEEQSRRSAWESRRVEILPGPPGMTVLQAAVAETDALRIHRRLTAIARGLDDDGRTLDQRRADLLVDSLLDAGRDRASTPHTPGPSSPESAPSPDDARPEICVIVGLDTLLGLVDGAADVPGLGPVPAGVARALAADGRWRAWITDAAGSAIAPASAGAPASAVVATGSRRYTPGPALARLVRAREVVCRMPGCQRPAGTCDLDHTVPWPHGETMASNLGPLCRRHHQLKTHCGWRLESTDLGWRWRLPSGLTQHDHADPPLE